MKRNLIKQKESYLITLPKKWITRNNLSKGTEIDIVENSNDLIVKAKSKKHTKEISINLDNATKDSMKIILWNLYRRGFDKITINDVQNYNYIHQMTESNLLGFEITKKDNKKIIIENISEPSEEKQDIILRRIFLIVQDSLDSIDYSYTNFDYIKQQSEKIIKYDNFCKRNIAQKRFTDDKTYFYWSLQTYLLLINRSIYHLYEQKPKSTQKEKLMINMLTQEYNKFHTAFFKKDIMQMKEFNKAVRSLEKGTRELPFITEVRRLLSIISSPALGIILD